MRSDNMGVNDLSNIVRQLLEEIRNLENKVEDIKTPIEETSDLLPSASASLQDVIEFTEKSTHSVMTLLDAIETNSKKIDEDVDTLLKFNPTKSINAILEDIKHLNQDNMNKIIEIYTAMSFQDITAQQIKKVIQAIEDTKRRLLQMVVSSIEATEKDETTKEKIIGKATEILTGDRIDQNDVDDLLKEFGL
jgi:chemotaxis protein CheZ